MDYGWAPLLLLVPPALVALAVVLDKRSRRGYALGTLALATLVLTLWGFGAVSHASQRANASPGGGLNLTIAVVAFVYVYGGLYVALALALGAVVETLIARQWCWLGVIIVVSVVPVALIVTYPVVLIDTLLAALGLPPSVASLTLLLPPALIILAYAIARSIRPPLAQ